MGKSGALAGPLLLLCTLLAEIVGAEEFVLGYLTGSQRKEGDLNYHRPGRTISGAISLAVEEVNKGPLGQRGHRLSFSVAETYGDEEVSIRETARLWSWNVSAYIGPQETCVHEGRLAAALNLPMISYYCRHHEPSDKSIFHTFARTRPPNSQISKSVAALLLAFNWTQVAFFYLNSDDTDFDENAETVLMALQGAGIRVPITRCWHVHYYYGFGDNPFLKLVKETFRDIRIYVILGYHYEHLGLMLAMEELQLFDKGEYWVVGVDIEEYDPESPEKYLKSFLKEHMEEAAPRAFRSYLGVSPTPPKGFTSFAAQVNRYMEKPPFNFTNAAGYKGIAKKIRAEAAYLYDAVHVYARALIHVLDQGGNPRNGTALVQAMRNQTYRSAMGYMVYMDENCDAEGNYTVIGLVDKFQVLGLYPVGMFLPRDSEGLLPRLHLYTPIRWLGDAQPVAEPRCGFRGEKCISHTTEIAASIAGGVVLLLTIIGLVFYRNWRYEQELDSLLWKVDYKEIQMQPTQQTHINGTSNLKPNGQAAGNTTSLLPIIRTSQVSLSSNPDADFRYSTIYTQIGVYRGRIFAIKRLPLRQIDINREMKKELKMMRDLRHDNLNAFIGACTEAPDICIVSEYCTRGSLKDILDNEDVKLDNMFIASLIGDIIRGLIFLHESPVRLHGNLKSSNCLVDSRWVVKLADFGNLLIKRFSQENEESSTAPNNIQKTDNQWQALLYRAPEILRRDNCSFMNRGGTQKGDVYSFGIVLYELHTRQGPFGEGCSLSCNEKSNGRGGGISKLSASELVQRVAYPPPGATLCRPPLEPLENSFDCVRECLSECWAEMPEERPDLKAVRARLRPLRKGMKPNIFDNMMAMMEKYANNLEALVDERTDQLVEEKKKTDALLLEMLPRYVAEQLKRGRKVEAESFDSVTIYFSDIVGFTSMSAESTPLEVVDFLNDLYTCFDSTIENYDVYKVETIGDAYMVVSGLPVRNGIEHAAEIASMSLRLLEGVKKFYIRHRPGEELKLRIGIHSGPVCAGVVGLKMPRYCLFGDTVNTASRMESTGLPLKIHCSNECKILLDTLGGYHLLERGSVRLKGKGERITFWLLGEDEQIRIARNEARAARKPKNKSTTALTPTSEQQQQPRSSLKSKNSASSVPVTNSVLSRCSSLESPKRLRFATGDRILEAITDNSPCRHLLSTQLLPHSTSTVASAVAELLRPVSSCPCIEDCTEGGRDLSPTNMTFRGSVPTLLRSRDVSEAPLLPNGRLPQM